MIKSLLRYYSIITNTECEDISDIPHDILAALSAMDISSINRFLSIYEYNRGLTAFQIANKLGISANKVKNYLYN
jgi:DNA-binding NarL/FixJ family response regulator